MAVGSSLPERDAMDMEAPSTAAGTIAGEARQTFDLRRALAAATEVHEKGRLDEAEAAYRRILETHGRQPEALFMLGVAAFQAGQGERARGLMEEAISLRRSQPAYWLALGQVRRHLGDLEGAARAFAQAADLEPASPAAHTNLSLALLAQGAREDGLRHFRRGVGLAMTQRLRAAVDAPRRAAAYGLGRFLTLGRAGPASRAAALCRLARTLERRGRREQALERCRRALTLDPTCREAHLRAGALLARNEMYLDAVLHFETVLAARPDDADALARLARALADLGRHAEALRHAERATRLAPDDPAAHRALAAVHFRAGRAEEAMRIYRRVLDREPGNVEALFGLGTCAHDLGRMDEAKARFRETLKRAPDHAAALHWLAALDGITRDDPAFGRMERLIQRGDLPPRSRCLLHFAAARVADKAGDPDEAFGHYRRGNDLKNVVFDAEAHAAWIGQIMETFDGARLRKGGETGDGSDLPVFIVGMPRSGTTLVEQILASHGAVHGAGELEFFNALPRRLPSVLGTDTPYPACVAQMDARTARALAAEYLDQLRELSATAARVSDKLPTNFLHLGLVALLLPNARVIHCRRDPLDVCVSIYRHHFGGDHPYAYDLTNLGLYYRQYERLMDHWRKVLPLRLLEVRYEDLIADQEGQSRRMISFCGLDWDPACLDFHRTERAVHTWSARQVRKPLYKGAVGRWRRYEAHLGPLKDALGL